MSARHLRRKIGDDLLASAAIESSEEDEVVVSPVKPMNMFDMVCKAYLRHFDATSLFFITEIRLWKLT